MRDKNVIGRALTSMLISEWNSLKIQTAECKNLLTARLYGKGWII